MRRLAIIFFFLLLLIVLAGILPHFFSVSAPKKEPITTPTVSNPVIQKPKNKLYFIALDDNGKRGIKIGCNDSVVFVNRELTSDEVTGTAVLNELLSYGKKTYEKTELYNALYQSNLTFVDATISGETAIVKLSGVLKMGGVCDAPRIEAQLTQTITQFPGVKKADIYINDVPLKELLSGK